MITLPRPLRGIVPPVLTPLLERDTLDSDAFRRLLNHLIQGGSSALFILGSTGEGPGLSHRLRRIVIECAVETVADRLPLLVGITDNSFVESVAIAKYAARAGATALVLTAPSYFNLSQAAFLGYLERLHAELPLPLYLYNIPRLTHLMIEPETVRAAAQLPLIYGVKDSSGDIEYFRQVREAVSFRPDFALLTGIEEILGQMVLSEGAHGGVCGGANLFPRLYVDVYEAALRHDTATIDNLQKLVMDVSSSVYNVGDPLSSYMRGLKCAASLAGFGNGLMAEPYWALREDEREMIRQGLERIQIWKSGTVLS
jgi:dihydrodipicolinate synthase/N-acetylneuraminate lyase